MSAEHQPRKKEERTAPKQDDNTTVEIITTVDRNKMPLLQRFPTNNHCFSLYSNIPIVVFYYLDRKEKRDYLIHLSKFEMIAPLERVVPAGAAVTTVDRNKMPLWQRFPTNNHCFSLYSNIPIVVFYYLDRKEKRDYLIHLSNFEMIAPLERVVPAGAAAVWAPQPVDDPEDEESNAETHLGNAEEEENNENGEDIEGEDAVINDGAPPPVLQQRNLGPDDPEHMHLAEEESQWARDIKDLVEHFPELDNLSDFQYAQLALIEHDNVEAALKRAHQMQTFRQMYGLTDTYEDGRRVLQAFIQRFPWHWLSFALNSTDGSYVFAYDMKRFNLNDLKTPDEFDKWMCACYYCLNCLTPDMTSIRSGALIAVECGGYDWTKNIDTKTYKRFWSELASAYPIHVQKMKHFNSGMFLNLLHSMTKRFIPAHIRDMIEVGNKLGDGQTLDKIFLTPNVETANQRVLGRMTEALKRRYEYERAFTLGTAS